MGKQKKTRKFAEVKRMLNPKELEKKGDKKVRNPPLRYSLLSLSRRSPHPFAPLALTIYPTQR
jgi:hypothetical protein